MVKNTLPVAPARTALLTDLRRWPGDGFFGQNTEVGNPTLLRDRSRNPDLGGRIPTLVRARQEASMPGKWRGRASMPGRFAETLDSGPQDNWIFFSQLSPHRTTGFFSQLSA